jgi:hypothetical protein
MTNSHLPRLLCLVLSAALLLSACQPIQPDTPSNEPSPSAPTPTTQATPAPPRQPRSAPAQADRIELPGLTIDRKANQLLLSARVVNAEYNLEFLLCKAGTKEYESVLSTPVQPWQIHAGLLLLGLAPGIPAHVEGDTIIPPRGAELTIDVRWTDTQGQARHASAGDFLAPRTEETPDRAPKTWVFIGSTVLPDGSYLADSNGGIIAVANLASAVIDVPFESTRAIEERDFVVNRNALPPVGTEVQLVITPVEDAANSPWARALLEIDAAGQMRIDSRPVTLAELEPWASAYTRRHPKAQVVIRSAAMTPACYSRIARTELKLGGVFDFQFDVAPMTGPLLPRTPGQRQADLARWADYFANPQDRIRDPGREVLDTLREIQRQRRFHQSMIELWTSYDRRLRKQLAEYEASRTTPQKSK